MSERPLTIYKVLTADELAALERHGSLAGSAADLADGFIHLSTAAQLAGTVDKHYAGQSALHLLAVDAEAQGARLKWEPARGGADFPHLYGPLLLETVIAYGPLEREPDGRIRLPVTG